MAKRSKTNKHSAAANTQRTDEQGIRQCGLFRRACRPKAEGKRHVAAAVWQSPELTVLPVPIPLLLSSSTHLVGSCHVVNAVLNARASA